MNFSPTSAAPAGETNSLTPRLIKGTQADYTPAPEYPGYDPSGIEPLGPNVLVRVDECSAVTAGGIHLADDMSERMTMASETGVIYAIGKTAWKGYAPDERPQVGDRILFERFAGLTPRGADGAPYRVMADSCIAGRRVPVLA